MGCTTLIAKVAALSLGMIASTCFFHDSELSRVSPRNFILSTVVTFLSLYIMSKLLRELFFVEKCIKWVFSQFKDIKLVLNHFCICWRILLVSFLKFIGSGFEMIKLVSSANKTILLSLFVKEGKSFMLTYPCTMIVRSSWIQIPWCWCSSVRLVFIRCYIQDIMHLRCLMAKCYVLLEDTTVL
jgi:hypothetical protein